MCWYPAKLVGVTSFLTFLVCSPVWAQEFPGEFRTIRVSGEGVVGVAPNQASIRLGVETQAETAAVALKENSAAVTKLLTVLKDQYKIAAKDLQTSSFSISPQYEQAEQPEVSSTRIIGYIVSNQVTVKVRKLAELGSLVDAAVAAGGNRISEILFEVDDTRVPLDEARKKAIGDARARAAVYAEAAGFRLGRIVSIEEFSGQAFPMGSLSQPLMAEAAAVPIEAGEQSISASVQVVYELVGARQ